ncbi:MAG: amidohydrolase family protein [Deltaproteobacteria bacterium]|nr:amidohydrolase family protein [Deltaproteobacteria bacterium]
MHTKEVKEILSILRSSHGKKPVDLLLMGGKLVNVYTGEILEGYSVAIKGKWIVRVDKDLEWMAGPKTEFLDLKGKYIIPGLIDGHAHILAYCHPHEILKYAVKRGVTSVITELLDISFKTDVDGMITYLKATKGEPVKVFATVPPFITLCEGAKRKIPDFKAIVRLLKLDAVVGIGEAFWQEVLRGHEIFFKLVPYAFKMRKTLEGHSAGCKGEKLQDYVLTGVSSCHEPITYDEVLERLRLGLYVMIREGSVRSDVNCLLGLSGSNLDTRRIVLVSDFMSPEDILDKGYMDYVVNRAIEKGINPVVAIQMATLNPATHFGLDGKIGGISPGRYADIVVTPEIKKIDPEIVISNGKIVVRDGYLYSQGNKKSLQIQGLKLRKVTPEDFLIKTAKRGKVKVRLIQQVTELVTKEIIEEVYPIDGEIRADPKNDIAQISYITDDGCYNYLVRGTGIKFGACATSSVWETYGILAIGIEPRDMAKAVNRILEMGGGMVIVEKECIVEELPLPIGSLISNLSYEEVVKRIGILNEKAKKMGIRWEKPLLSLETFTTPAIPFFRISDRGLVDLKTGQVMGLFVD